MNLRPGENPMTKQEIAECYARCDAHIAACNAIMEDAIRKGIVRETKPGYYKPCQ